jgi:formylglycine-generating enzyme required for sulfatase activity
MAALLLQPAFTDAQNAPVRRRNNTTQGTGSGSNSSSRSNNGNNNRSSTNNRSNNLCPDDRHPHVIDLGLPSGTKWACSNVGASKPEEYGYYFAWGETWPKSNYDWSTYRWCNGSSTTLTKYNPRSDLGTVDNKTQLEPSDDAARALCGGSWRMPTIAELTELKDNCTYEWTTINGVKGGKFTSRSNGRSVFFPAAGYCWRSEQRDVGLSGYYWSSSLDESNSNFVLVLNFASVGADTDSYIRRIYGGSVRPVQQQPSSVQQNNNAGGSQPAATSSLSPVLQRLVDNMVYVEGGTFQMGSNDSDAESNEMPVHQVTLSSYYIGKYEVTQEEWEAVMGSNPSNFRGARLPVEMVSWNDCQTFIQRLNQLTGQHFRLPTEAEWEFAARGGNAGKSHGYKYSGSASIDAIGWYTSNSGIQTHPVGQKQANELGLFDMTGNVCEWCQDWYGSYSSQVQTNPTGPSSASGRVIRSGGWYLDARNCRVSIRGSRALSNRFSSLGLRLAR